MKRPQMNIISYLTVIWGCIIIWGLLNVTNGYNLFDESQLNVAKGMVAVFGGFFGILIRPYIPASMVKYIKKL